MASDERESNGRHLENGKYLRYTSEQVEALERYYKEGPKPNLVRREQMIRECPELGNFDEKQIKVWFQNRRGREKRKKETSQLHTVNRKLNAVNKLLLEENQRLQTQVSLLLCQLGYMRRKQHIVQPALSHIASSETVVTQSADSHQESSNPAGLQAVAEETLAGFLAKATGTAMDWVQMAGMKPGPDSDGIFSISHSGVAARACGLASLEPKRIAEILKDRQAWFRDCRRHEVVKVMPSGNGGTIELVYTQLYAPTTLAPARDFWTLRYTASLDNGSIAVCERSVSGHGDGPSAADSAQFIRAEMLPSGYLIRPCDEGESTIHIVDHLNLQASTVPEVIRPLYESSNVVAHNMTIAALRYVRQVAQDTNDEVVYDLGMEPAMSRTLSQRLRRGFNDAINGFNDDGWSVMNFEGSDNVIVAVTSANNIVGTSNLSNPPSLVGGVLCAKGSMLLQNVHPAVLVRFIREHRSEWAGFCNGNSHAYPERSQMAYTGGQTIMQFGQTIEHEETLEVIQLEGQTLSQEDASMSRSIQVLQLCSGLDENAVGACSELVFSPISEAFTADSPLIPSGVRVIPLDLKSGDVPNSFTPNLPSSLEAGHDTNSVANNSSSSIHNMQSVLTFAFQFPYNNIQVDSVATVARQYVRKVASYVHRVAMTMSSSGVSPAAAPKLSYDAPNAQTLANWICHSYRFHLRVETDLPNSNSVGDDTMLNYLWDHQNPIFCFSPRAPPVFLFANQAGLNMLETTLVALQDITLENIFDDIGCNTLYESFDMITQQGFAFLPSGSCISTMGRHVLYEQALVWKVLAADKITIHCLAISFENWSFV